MLRKFALPLLLLLLAWGGRAAAFDLQFAISDPTGMFTSQQVQLLEEALQRAERMWETVITGYHPGVDIPVVPISVYPTTGGLASANFNGQMSYEGYWLPTGGFINMNVNEVLNFSNWQGPGANGRNYLDELLAHEVGHVLGIGTLWDDNGDYVSNTWRYTGRYGLAAYQMEFEPAAEWAPVENAGNTGTPNAHWDQLMRSSPQEGNPMDPYALDPRVGVVDPWGRDRALELMTGAIDPDWMEPYISRFTVQSLRDMGYLVTEFADCNGDGVVDLVDRDVILANMGVAGLEIDSFAFGDINRDRTVDAADLDLWAAEAPEPSAGVLAAVLLGWNAAAARRRRSPRSIAA